MLFYLFITFQILYSVSCYISCYTAPFDINDFNYIVTADHFPSELKNYSLQTNSSNCYIMVLWQRNPDNTRITLVAGPNMTTAPPTQHQLQVFVGYETGGSSTPMWIKQVIYQCYTDQCNSLSDLKSLLRALTVNESLYELTYLLNPVKPFHGEWCYRDSNVTLETCNTTIPVSLCTQCSLVETMNEGKVELCATCSTEEPENALLIYEKTFNMTDRTDFSMWAILCGRESCNTPAIGDSIHEKCSISFDFTKFTNNETITI